MTKHKHRERVFRMPKKFSERFRTIAKKDQERHKDDKDLAFECERAANRAGWIDLEYALEFLWSGNLEIEDSLELYDELTPISKNPELRVEMKREIGK